MDVATVITALIGGIAGATPVLVAQLVKYGRLMEKVDTLKERVECIEREGSPALKVMNERLAGMEREITYRLDRNSAQMDSFIKEVLSLTNRVTSLEVTRGNSRDVD